MNHMKHERQDTTRKPRRFFTLRLAQLAFLLAVPLCIGGCRDVAGWAAQVVGGDMRETTYQVDAKYRTLPGHSVAVIIEADQYIYFQYPSGPSTLQRAVVAELSAKLNEKTTTVRLTDPGQIEKFQKENPYWHTLPYGELLKRLNVQRVILIDLSEFSLHEPGNANVWKGVARGSVGVLEDNAANPTNFTFTESVNAVFPNDSEVGVLNSNDTEMRFGLSKVFAQQVVGLFYDHKMKEKN
jgi:hypothetical protein